MVIGYYDVFNMFILYLAGRSVSSTPAPCATKAYQTSLRKLPGPPAGDFVAMETKIKDNQTVWPWPFRNETDMAPGEYDILTYCGLVTPYGD